MDETRVCQNCKGEFKIDASDFEFYKKLDVPPPTFCPACRLQRRLAFQNQRSLYKRTCDLCDKSIISMYREDAPFPVYCMACYESDKWDPFVYGVDYDFSKPFFEQLGELRARVPQKALMGLYATWKNSEYNNMAQELKNCYLLFNSDFNEDCSYGSEVEGSRNCMDITMVDKCEYVIGSTGCLNCNKVFFSFDCDGCHSVWLSKDLTNCSDCFGCAGLRNMKYCLFNEQLTKDEYERRLAEINTGSYMQFQEMAERAKNTWLSVPNRYMHGRHNDVVSGEYINNSKNVRDSYIVFEGQDCRYCMWLVIKPNKDCYDYTQFGENAQSMYETLTTGKGVSNIRFSNFCTSEVSRLTYCDACHNGSADLFACIGMRKKQYCIFNKKYTKEQYEELVPKIITQMNELPFIDKKGREYKFGEYLPIELSPFAYNETDAQEYYPMTKAAVIDAGYKWFEIEEKKHQETIMWSALPDEIGGVSDAITKQIILCKTWAEDSVHAQEQLCTKVYRILPQELVLYKNFNIPLPRLCPNCRHYERVKQRNPIALYRRQCMCLLPESLVREGAYQNTSKHSHGDEPCANEFETSYSPDPRYAKGSGEASRPEIVYCEQCYQQEMA